MAAQTGIGWTDGTANFWIGCTKVGPGCEGCYAEVFADRKFGTKFGPGEKRWRTKSGYAEPLKWQRMHEKADLAGERAEMKHNFVMVPVPIWIFTNSLADFFDNEIDPQWRTDAWDVIRKCSHLRWQIVTKRVGNVQKMLPGDWMGGRNYRNVGIIATMVTQEEYDRDAPKLADLYNAGVNWTGISIEPQLGPITLSRPTDWVICGGESTQGDHTARPFHLEWARNLRDQCAKSGIPFFMKQLGSNSVPPRGDKRSFGKAGDDPKLWPGDLKVQQMPRIYDRRPQLEQPSLFDGAA